MGAIERPKKLSLGTSMQRIILISYFQQNLRHRKWPSSEAFPARWTSRPSTKLCFNTSHDVAYRNYFQANQHPDFTSSKSSSNSFEITKHQRANVRNQIRASPNLLDSERRNWELSTRHESAKASRLPLLPVPRVTSHTRNPRAAKH